MNKIFNVLCFIFLLSFVKCSFTVLSGRVMGNSTAATHTAPLLTIVANTKGPILEMGCGDFSTPVLHAICSSSKRFLCSAEGNKSWLNFFTDLEKEWHHFYYVSSFNGWDKIGNGIRWSVVFIDHAPAKRRVMDIKRLRKNTDIFVVHDTQDSVEISYGYKPVLSSFKYKYVYKRYKVTTTVVSDVIDVKKFFE